MSKSYSTIFTLVWNMKKNKKRLNEDLVNNYLICKDISNKMIEKTNVPFEVIGKENIPSDGPTLITSNHRSFFDIFSLIYAIDRPMSFAAAKELLSYPYVKKYINGIECVLIDRNTKNLKKMREQLIEMEKTIRKNGLVLFPEGECSYDRDETIEFKKGGFMSTIKDNVTIVPTYINYEELTKVIGKWMIPTKKTTIIFGKSFTPKEVFEDKVTALKVATYSRNKVLELKTSINSKEIS